MAIGETIAAHVSRIRQAMASEIREASDPSSKMEEIVEDVLGDAFLHVMEDAQEDLPTIASHIVEAQDEENVETAQDEMDEEEEEEEEDMEEEAKYKKAGFNLAKKLEETGNPDAAALIKMAMKNL